MDNFRDGQKNLNQLTHTELNNTKRNNKETT